MNNIETHDILELATWLERPPTSPTAIKAATKLRSLLKEHEEDQDVIRVWRGRTQRAEAQRDALLEALQRLCSKQPRTNQQIDADWDNARAAIKAVKGETK